MAKDQLKYVRQLIQAQRFDDARTILQSLALEDETAKEWLIKLNQMAPPVSHQRIEVQQKGTFSSVFEGCIAIVAAYSLILAGLAFCIVVFCIGGIIFLVAVGEGVEEARQADQAAAIQANNNLGTLDNPIPFGTPVKFRVFDISAMRLIRPATDRVTRSFNEPPAAGADYVMVRFRLDCKKTGSDVCRGYDFKVRLVDAEGAEWGEPTLIFVDDDLDPKEAIGGGSIEGWQVFEFPQNHPIVAIKLWVTGETTLYAIPPEA